MSSGALHRLIRCRRPAPCAGRVDATPRSGAPTGEAGATFRLLQHDMDLPDGDAVHICWGAALWFDAGDVRLLLRFQGTYLAKASGLRGEICYGKEGRNHLDIFLPRPLGARAKDVLCVPDGQKPKQTNGRTLGRQPKQGSLQSLLIKGAAGAANGDGDKDLTSLRYLDTTVPIQHVEPLASKRSDTATGNGDARLAPVVIMVSGGAWLIGYKGWGGFVARKLAELGIMVVSVDYRNFPEAQVSDMVSDVEHAVEWVCRNIEKYGGDPANVTLCGHSAGAHLGACVMLRRAMKQRQLPHGSAGEDEISGHKLASFVGLSGAYNLRGIMEHCHEMGLYRHVFLELFEGEENLDEYSPALFVEQQTNMQGIVLPPIHLMHGSADKTIPYKSTVSFAEILRDKGALVRHGTNHGLTRKCAVSKWELLRVMALKQGIW
eukprot:scaffold2585_cov368-Prasinococcus_capsulatus_cf.AAC.19